MNTTIHIEGMTCGHCSARVARALEALDGVSAVNIALENGEAKINFDEEKITREQLVEAIQDTGFGVRQ